MTDVRNTPPTPLPENLSVLAGEYVLGTLPGITFGAGEGGGGYGDSITLRGYTANGAYQLRLDDRTGMLTAGRAADLTVLGAHVERELALVKVRGTGDHRIEALRLADVYRARVVDATTSSFVFEVTGGIEKIDKFVELMSEVGLIEVARTGIVAIARGKDAA